MAASKFSFERFLARRYLTGGTAHVQGSRFVRFIILAAIAGVAVGVASLLLALSITRGFSHEIERKIVDFSAHIQVESFLDAPLENSAVIQRQLEEIEGVTRVSPAVLELALIRTQTDIDGIVIWGTEDAGAILDQYLVKGQLGSVDSLAGKPGIVISKKQSELLNVDMGGTVTCFSMRENRNTRSGRDLLFGRPRVKQFNVIAIYDTGFGEIDDRFSFVDMDVARDLLAYESDQTTRFDVEVVNLADVDGVVVRIEDQVGFPAMARTVFEVHRNLFAWVGLQESIIPLIIAIIILVAAFNSVGTLLMMVLEKTGEIGILGSMGASRERIQRVFLWLGLLIGGVGIVLGEAIALILALVQQRFSIIPLPRDTYYMDTAPIILSAFDFLLVAVIALALCLLAAYAPARVASRIDPIRTIRFSG